MTKKEVNYAYDIAKRVGGDMKKYFLEIEDLLRDAHSKKQRSNPIMFINRISNVLEDEELDEKEKNKMIKSVLKGSDNKIWNALKNNQKSLYRYLTRSDVKQNPLRIKVFMQALEGDEAKEQTNKILNKVQSIFNLNEELAKKDIYVNKSAWSLNNMQKTIQRLRIQQGHNIIMNGNQLCYMNWLMNQYFDKVIKLPKDKWEVVKEIQESLQEKEL
jgi:hypothetical protein